MSGVQLEVQTHARAEMVDITALVDEIVRGARVADGACMVFCPHTTAGVLVTENTDPAVLSDILNQLDRLVPVTGPYQHREGNAHAHIKAALVGCGVTVPVSGGCLALGTWQGIFLAEFDGPRRRRLRVEMLPLVGPAATR
ncbi:MAG: secondary thiamine-phosphate synthase enzyme YjbQ [Bacillota bacterium]|nr:secondary thiamine-phosphate synthase enzyme YjbQ [Bacillota bacterium]